MITLKNYNVPKNIPKKEATKLIISRAFEEFVCEYENTGYLNLGWFFVRFVSCFTWSESKEGYDFWAKVSRNWADFVITNALIYRKDSYNNLHRYV